MSNEPKRNFHVICSTTKGGDPKTAKVLWTRDMTEDEYSKWLEREKAR